ncbi:MAG TPA: hypothetical protein VK034_30815, partial [Enhygromyxa sp.]|nr:hypothetical protein [Enhygromyxa sp.]
HDVGALCARAFHADTQFHDGLLETFLRVDDATETAHSDTTLKGVRKAQVKLATTYMIHGAESLARRIQADMKGEPAERLRGIWKELAALKDREFWEVNDRGSNFDYLSDEQKVELPRFFSWFPALHDEAIQSMRKGMVEPSGVVSVPINLP